MDLKFCVLLLFVVCVSGQFPFSFPPIIPIFCGPNEVRGDSCVTPDRLCGRRRPENTTNCRRCICRPNYVRDRRGRCISREDCDRCNVDENEEYLNCGPSCPLVCGEPIPRGCDRRCVEGCFCVPGYIRSSRNGTCVPESQCTPSCPENSNFTRCRPLFPRICNQTSILRDFGIRICLGIGCRCNPGYVMTPNRKGCVPESECR
uniref:Putative conserved secreted protein n=1 Tax=Antricola delacruzi TaxID=480319 RepID=M4GYG5_ANTDE